VDLQSPGDPPGVGQVQVLPRPGVGGQQGGHRLGRGEGLDGLPRRRVVRRELEGIDQGPEVQAGAADDQGRDPAPGEVG